MFRENWCESLWRVANVRNLFMSLCVFHEFGERHNSFIVYWFCKCFVEMHLTFVGGCQMFVFGLFYNVCLCFRGLGRAKRKHIMYFIFVLYAFRENWCESLWKVSSVRILFILLCVFYDFEFCWFYEGFVNVLWRDPGGDRAGARPITGFEWSTSTAL